MLPPSDLFTVDSFPLALMLSVILLSVIMLSVIMLSVIMLSVIMLSVIMLSVIMLSVILLSVIMLNVILLSVILLNVVMLSAVAPFQFHNFGRNFEEPKFLGKNANTNSSTRWSKANIRGQCYKTFYDRNLRLFVISCSVCPCQDFPV